MMDKDKFEAMRRAFNQAKELVGTHPASMRLTGVGYDPQEFARLLAENPDFQVFLEGLLFGENRYSLEFSLALRSIIQELIVYRDEADSLIEMYRALEYEIKHHPEGKD
jgi:hypothetical protein